jgi:type I restriction enzyme S subunit
VRFRATSAVLPAYALLVFLHYFKSGLFQRIARITTNIAHLGAGRFAEMSFPVPSIAEQREILDRVAMHSGLYDHSIAEIANRKQQVRSLRQSVLCDAFAGRLVPQDPTDEPSQSLLERIAAERNASPKLVRAKSVRRKKVKA